MRQHTCPVIPDPLLTDIITIMPVTPRIPSDSSMGFLSLNLTLLPTSSNLAQGWFSQLGLT